MVDDLPEDLPHVVFGEEHEQSVSHHHHHHGSVARDLLEPVRIDDRRADRAVLRVFGVKPVGDLDDVRKIHVIPPGMPRFPRTTGGTGLRGISPVSPTGGRTDSPATSARVSVDP
ncbi:hypothetical protein FHR32_005312 [Streptosporangium album]|uniref:Uncharacterized protein n=1 Tax=Streptosporangium album TaxID=47479 RepID=A0A7W7WC40_9ACTN|nr:hypothetical protein [Streptosporangium album]MBB4940935.1 hypothetical protein [Streptosporangium album]